MLSSVQGGFSQQTHPARAVMEILKSGAKMSMLAVDIGAAGGNPEIGPLFRGDAVTEGRKWGGIQVDPRVQFLDRFAKVKNVESTAQPPTIAGILWDNCMPHDIDILKLDIDCYGEEKSVSLALFFFLVGASFDLTPAVAGACFADYDVAEAILMHGYRPKVFAAEVSISFPPPIHMHVKYHKDFKWSLISTRP